MVSDIPAGDRKIANLFLQCILVRISVVDPDPHLFGSAGSDYRFRRAKLPTKIEKSGEISCFEVLDDFF